MTYLAKVKSPLKGGVDVELGERTLILGPNGAGKSAITASVEFLYTGKVSDIVGRTTVAAVNDLLTLGPGDELWATGVLSDGKELELRLRGKKVPLAPYPQALPLRDVREALAGGVDTVRKFFLRMAAGAVTREDVENRIPGPYRDLFAALVAATPVTTAPVDLLLYALEKAKERAREITAEAKASTTVTVEVTQGLAPASTKDLTTAREALAAARDSVESLTRRLGVVERARAALGEADATAALVEKLTHELAKIAAPQQVDLVRENLIGVVKFCVSKKLGACPCCRQEHHYEDAAPEPHVGPFSDEFWAQRLHLLESKHKERKLQLAEYEAMGLSLEQAKREQAAAEYTLMAFQRDGESDNVDDATRLATELEHARQEAWNAEQRVIQLERTGAAWEQARKSRDAAAEREIQASRWAALADACKTAVGELMDQSTAAFVDKVQKFLPATDHFFLKLHEEDREVCRYGFARSPPAGSEQESSERYDTALSGAEWARLTAALAAAYLGAPSEEPRVIIPDDRSWDSHTLTLVLEALEAAPCQVIVATTTEPDEFPNGWKVIRVGGRTEESKQEIREDDADEARPAGSLVSVKPCSHGVKPGAYCLACEREAAAARAAPKQTLSETLKPKRAPRAKKATEKASAAPEAGNGAVKPGQELPPELQ